MKIPEFIHIGAHTIDVVRQPLMRREDCYGTFDATTLVITIDDGIPETLAWETFWHEVIEALNVFAEADMQHHSIQVMGLLLHQVVASIPGSRVKAVKNNDVTPITKAKKAAKSKAPSHKKRG